MPARAASRDARRRSSAGERLPSIETPCRTSGSAAAAASESLDRRTSRATLAKLYLVHRRVEDGRVRPRGLDARRRDPARARARSAIRVDRRADRGRPPSLDVRPSVHASTAWLLGTRRERRALKLDAVEFVDWSRPHVDRSRPCVSLATRSSRETRAGVSGVEARSTSQRRRQCPSYARSPGADARRRGSSRPATGRSGPAARSGARTAGGRPRRTARGTAFGLSSARCRPQRCGIARGRSSSEGRAGAGAAERRSGPA